MSSESDSEAQVECADGGIAPSSDESGHVERRAHRPAAALHRAPAAHPATVAISGATPTRAAILRRSRVPSSGSSARSVRAVVLPTPGTEVRSCSSAR